jgi:hypothetical protein
LRHVREIVIDTLFDGLVNLMEPGVVGTLWPICVHWLNIVLDAMMAAGEIIVSTASAQ